MTDPAPIPQPAQPLEYGNPYDRGGRPGLVTAMGVMSIVVASISIIAGIVGALMSFSFLMMASAPAMPLAAPMPAPTTSNTATVSGGLIVTPEEDGVDASTADQIVGVMSRRSALSEQEQSHLKALLEQAGKLVFPVAGETAITAQFVRTNITASGTILGNVGRSGATYFVTGGGRVEVHEDRAIFRPTKSADVLMVSAPSTVTFQQRNITVGPRGMSVSTSTTAPATLPTMMMPRMNAYPPATVLGSVGLGELLAILLLISGIIVLRDGRSGRRLHWIYVAVKLPLVVISTAAWIWMLQKFFGAFASIAPGAAAPRAAMMGMAIWPLFFGAAAAAYPIGLIFVLMSRTVRDYYGAVVD